MIEFGFSGASTTGTFQMHKTVYDTSVTPNTVKSNVTKNESVSIDLFMAHANYIYNFFLQHRGKVVGFVTGGGGILNSSMFGQTADPDMQPIIDLLVGDENDLMYDYGAGIRFFGSEKVCLRVDARQVRYSSSSRRSLGQIQSTF